MYKKVIQSGLLCSLLSLSFSIMADEQTIEANDEEVTDRIFEEWYGGKDGLTNIYIFRLGSIMKMEEGNLINLSTFVDYENVKNLLPEEQDILPIFIAKHVYKVKQDNYVDKDSIFVDRRTRCEMYKRAGVIRCSSIFTKQEFQKRVQQKESWWPWNRKRLNKKG